MMFRNILLIAILGFFASCSNDDESLEDIRTGKPVATLDKSQADVVEGESVTFTITLDRSSVNVSRFKIDLVDYDETMDLYSYDTSGSPVGNDDSFGAPGFVVTVPAFATTAEFTITPKQNFELDGNRTMNFHFTGVQNMNAVVDDAFTTISLNVADQQDAVGLQLDWANTEVDLAGNLIDGEYLGEDGALHSYQDWDFDMYLYNSAGDNVSDFDAATGDIPEVLVFDNAALPDDTYRVVVDLYGSGTLGASDMTFPLSLKVNAFGSWDYSLPVADYTFLDEGDDSGANMKVVALLEKNGNNYTLKSADGQTVLAP
ncbi:hypothetical protein GO491_02010 [Flavobacteriaceae bacterium Ap0902]|nr:hypothetical protein [Flavobacteriaceae bacterium Ap0902]